MANRIIDRAVPKPFGMERGLSVGPLFRLGILAVLGVGGGGLLGCRDVVGTAALPPGTQSPAVYNTPEGALAMYREVKVLTSAVLGGGSGVIITAGALTDELLAAGVGTGPQSVGATGDPIDERILPEGETNTDNSTLYSALHRLRGDARQAIGLLQHYAPNTSPALRGELYALLGYAELQLGELYCSGVPLSTLDFEQDFTYKPGSTTQEVLAHVVALEDTALALSGDSAGTLNLARVLQGRALLELGHYDAAAQAVAAVPGAFRYDVPVKFGVHDFAGLAFLNLTVADTEGSNGLPFVSGGDPRVRVSPAPEDTNVFGRPLFTPDQYPLGTLDSVVLASGVEARLIEAEAALRAGDPNWLTILNTLRTSCTDAASCPTPAPAGTGGVAGLSPLEDPGSDTARVSLLFAERAYWLFLTGHRQGDLRRLVRAVSDGGYGRRQDRVYPTGAYYGGQGVYGSDVNLSVPADAEGANPLFHGCLDRGA